jgi:hypothetical protein
MQKKLEIFHWISSLLMIMTFEQLSSCRTSFRTRARVAIELVFIWSSRSLSKIIYIKYIYF